MEPYARISASFARTASPSVIDSAAAITSLRSTVCTAMPCFCRIFSEKRTVLNATGRAPSIAIRAPRRPLTTRQTPAKRSRSASNSGPSIGQVCSCVRLNGIPRWYRLLHRLSLPQNASRRFAMSSLSKSSSHACTRTGTFSPASEMASATPSSSPKLGRMQRMPSISSA